MNVNFLDVLWKLNRPVDLYFLVRVNDARSHFFSLGRLNGWFKLIFGHLHQNRITIPKGGNGGLITPRVHVCKSASVPHMLFQKEVRLPVARASLNSFRVISKIDRSVLDSFKIGCWMMMVVEHPVLPLSSYRAFWVSDFKDISVVGIASIISHVSRSSHMDDNWGIMGNVVVEIF